MDRLHAVEIGHLQRLQHAFGDYSDVMLFLSRVGDPRSAFLVYVPLVYCINRAVGIKVLWAAVMSEWLNLALKWLLNGQRPYWWVHESGIYETDNRPIIKQYELTCETGPGVPSGHAMITTAVWFVMMSPLATYLSAVGQKDRRQTRLLSMLPWLFLAGLASVICISRVFIATHFTHQVLLGVVVGILVGVFITKLSIDAFSTSSHIAFAVSVVAAALLQSRIMTALDVDPTWSMQLAVRWCQRKEWVHLDTTPLYCIARDFGSLALMAITERFVDTKREILPLYQKCLASVISLLFAQLMESVELPRDNVSIFYALGAVKFGAVMVGVVAIKRMCSIGQKKNKKTRMTMGMKSE